MRALIGVTCPTQVDLNGTTNYTYCRMIQDVGAVPLVCSLPSEVEQVEPILGALDALVLTDEACQTRADDALARQFLLAALERDVPILAVDSGCRLLNEVLGGRASEPSGRLAAHEQGALPGHMPCHTLRLDPWSCLATCIGDSRLEANSFHRLIITQPGRGLVPVAWSDDGTIEAVESKAHTFVMGVQFRPHLMATCGPRIFKAFRRSAETYRQRKRQKRQLAD